MGEEKKAPLAKNTREWTAGFTLVSPYQESAPPSPEISSGHSVWGVAHENETLSSAGWMCQVNKLTFAFRW